MTEIHPTAIISPGAKIGNNANIGPYSIIGDGVIIGNDAVLKSHVVIEGNTIIGDNNHFFPFCSIGTAPQDKKYSGEDSKLIIGDNNVIREHVTINPGTQGGGLTTKVGNNCLFMVGSHVAHDCQIGNNVIMANNATLAGHVKVGDFAILGGLSAVRQFVRIGQHAMIGGMAGIESDVIPYGLAMNERASLEGINIVGLKRRGFERDSISAIMDVYNTVFSNEEGKTFANKLDQMADVYKDNKDVMIIIDFLKADSSRAICKPKTVA
jgi:UDP-N-acetylglucosamine acyltransferase